MDCISSRTKSLAELDSMVALRRASNLRKLSRLHPVKFPGVDDNATNRCSMTTDPLGRAMHDNIRTELDGLNNVATSPEGVVDDERNAMVVCDLGKGGDVVDHELRVRD